MSCARFRSGTTAEKEKKKHNASHLVVRRLDLRVRRTLGNTKHVVERLLAEPGRPSGCVAREEPSWGRGRGHVHDDDAAQRKWRQKKIGKRSNLGLIGLNKKIFILSEK